jgi:SNF2 family DNA or RNA helicase
LLQADHRLALSGTPIENRIEELWSLFEFLNPGMLGAATTFSSATRTLAALRPGMPAGTGVSAQELLSRALRPVVLRRTKAMVAKELPARIEQTIEVELEPKQRAFYEQLRSQYASSLLDRVERDGVGKSRMHILEALLRLRQAACHPALVDPTKASLPSAKLDAVAGLQLAFLLDPLAVLVDTVLGTEVDDHEGVAGALLDAGVKSRERSIVEDNVVFGVAAKTNHRAREVVLGEALVSAVDDQPRHPQTLVDRGATRRVSRQSEAPPGHLAENREQHTRQTDAVRARIGAQCLFESHR